MAQGKEWTDEEKETIIQSLREYLELGFSRNKACSFIGLAPSTLCNWINQDEALGMRIEGWENAINKVVMANLLQAIKKEGEMEDDVRKENSWKWAERRMKDDFAVRTENTGKEGKDLIPEPISQEEKERLLSLLNDRESTT